jgi:hypothetical protein
VDGTGNVYIADTGNVMVDELPYVFVDPSPRVETGPTGTDALPPVLPPTENLGVPFTPTSSNPWVTLTSTNNGVVAFSFAATTPAARQANISLFGTNIPVLEYVLGATNLLVGPAPGTNSVVLGDLSSLGTWAAYSHNTNWLQVAPANRRGAGGTNVFFTCDANPGGTRTGTLTIGRLDVSVTQAGTTYVPAGQVTPLPFTGLTEPEGVTVDGAGDVFCGNDLGKILDELPFGGPCEILPATALKNVQSLAVDVLGNVYIADNNKRAVWEWSGGSFTTLVSGLGNPTGVAVDGAGDVFITDSGTTNVYELPVGATGNGSLAILASAGSGLLAPTGVAVDAADNVYIADGAAGAVFELPFSGGPLLTLANTSAGLSSPSGLAVDGSGNVYIADNDAPAIFELPAGGTNLITLAGAGLNTPWGVAVDGADNVYFTDAGDQIVYELPHAFVDPTPRNEGVPAGSDALPVVLPVTAYLGGPFAPTNNSPAWLTILNTNGGVVNFSFTTNTGPVRTALINLLGINVPVNQTNPPAQAGVYTVYRTAGLVLHIFWNNVITNWTDVSGPPVFTGMNLVTTNGVTVLTNSVQILYPASAPNVNDQITYTITDATGEPSTGRINVVVNPFVSGQQNSAPLIVSGGRVALTFYGIPGLKYDVQRSTNLTAWATIESNYSVDSTGPNAGLINIIDLFSDLGYTPPSVYYRLVWNP